LDIVFPSRGAQAETFVEILEQSQTLHLKCQGLEVAWGLKNLSERDGVDDPDSATGEVVRRKIALIWDTYQLYDEKNDVSQSSYVPPELMATVKELVEMHKAIPKPAPLTGGKALAKGKASATPGGSTAAGPKASPKGGAKATAKGKAKGKIQKSKAKAKVKPAAKEADDDDDDEEEEEEEEDEEEEDEEVEEEPEAVPAPAPPQRAKRGRPPKAAVSDAEVPVRKSGRRSSG